MDYRLRSATIKRPTRSRLSVGTTTCYAFLVLGQNVLEPPMVTGDFVPRLKPGMAQRRRRQAEEAERRQEAKGGSRRRRQETRSRTTKKKHRTPLGKCAGLLENPSLAPCWNAAGARIPPRLKHVMLQAQLSKRVKTTLVPSFVTPGLCG